MWAAVAPRREAGKGGREEGRQGRKEGKGRRESREEGREAGKGGRKVPLQPKPIINLEIHLWQIPNTVKNKQQHKCYLT